MQAPAHVRYSVHPSVEYARSILDNLPEKTGRTAEEWAALVLAEGPVQSKARRTWLKQEHGVGGTTASLIVALAEDVEPERVDGDAYLKVAEEYVEDMFSGKKAHLRPLYEAILEYGVSLGDDVRVCPCKTIVPLYRNHVFAQINPATQKRIDLGFCLRDVDGLDGDRLIDTGGLEKGDRITHKVGMTSVDEFDDEVKGWMQLAYGLDG